MTIKLNYTIASYISGDGLESAVNGLDHFPYGNLTFHQDIEPEITIFLKDGRPEIFPGNTLEKELGERYTETPTFEKIDWSVHAARGDERHVKNTTI